MVMAAAVLLLLPAAAGVAAWWRWSAQRRRLQQALADGSPEATEHVLRSDTRYAEVAKLLQESDDTGEIDGDVVVPLCRGLSPLELDQRLQDRLRQALTLYQSATFARTTIQKTRSVTVSPRMQMHLAELQDISQCLVGKALPVPAPEWKECGFQSDNPCRDFRGGGALALRCLTSFCRTHGDVARRAVERNGDCVRERKELWFLLAVESICATCDLIDWYDSTRGAPAGQNLSAYFYQAGSCSQSHLETFQHLHDLLLLEEWRRWEKDQPHGLQFGKWRDAWACPANFRTLFGEVDISLSGGVGLRASSISPMSVR